MQNSPLRKNTAKIHLHLEKFSLKTNWRLAEILLYNQGCKKEPHGRKGSDQVRATDGGNYTGGNPP